MDAIDKGEIRTVMCWFRGLYGNYPRRFYLYFMDLTPAGPALRKYILFRIWKTVTIAERLESAWLRPCDSRQEARRIGSNGAYGLEIVGNQIVCCKTTEGVLEFAVKRTDVPLLLHYITMKARQPDPSSQS